MVIETHPVAVVPPPIVVPPTTTRAYVLPSDTIKMPNGATLITPADTGLTAIDSSNGAKVSVQVHIHTNAPPTITATIQPDTAHGSLTDTVSGRIAPPEIVHKPTFGQGTLIVFVTLGCAALLLAVLYFIGKIKIP